MICNSAMFFVVGASHKTAPVELRERLAVRPPEHVDVARHLKSCCELEELVLISTCNRVEIYGTMPRVGGTIDSLLELLTGSPRDFRQHIYAHENAEAASHLFRVVSGLDSMVLGETEITGQVKRAYETARAAKLTSRSLNRAFQSAFQVVKEIRTRTGIGRGSTSIGGAGVELAEKIFGHDLSGQSVMIVGAGQMGEACMRHLTKKGAQSILVSNRSFDRAVELAAQFGGRAVRFEDCQAALAGVDIVVASTCCPKILLQRADIEQAMVRRRNRPLILIDISVPRNIDPEAQGIENVYLYNIDDLNAIVGENVRNRERELALCNRIIEARTAELMEKLHVAEDRRRQSNVPLRAGWTPQPAAVAGGGHMLPAVFPTFLPRNWRQPVDVT